MNDEAQPYHEFSLVTTGSRVQQVGRNAHESLEVDGLAGVRRTLESLLQDFNAVQVKPLSLVLFRYAIQHVCRIARILRLPDGHALLVGAIGSGRRSLMRLASFA